MTSSSDPEFARVQRKFASIFPDTALGTAQALANGLGACRTVLPCASSSPAPPSPGAVLTPCTHSRAFYFSISHTLSLSISPVSSRAEDLRLRDKVIAYAISFAQQFLKLGRPELSSALLAAYSGARAERNLPNDKRATVLLPQVLSACAASQQREIERLKLELRTAAPIHRAPLATSLEEAERALQPTLAQLRQAEVAAAACGSGGSESEAAGLTSLVGRMSLSSPRAGGMPTPVSTPVTRLSSPTLPPPPQAWPCRCAWPRLGARRRGHRCTRRR